MPPSKPDGTEHSPGWAEGLEIDLSVHLSGRLVETTVGEFERAIRAAVQASPREIVVDLAEVEFVDPSGQTALLKAHLRSRRHGHPIEFVPSNHEMVRQLVSITGTDEISD
jgi:anti-anti-sigma factor